LIHESCRSAGRSITGRTAAIAPSTLDGRALYRWRPAAGAVAERTCEERLSHILGAVFAMRPDGKSGEIVGVATEAMDLISSRRRKVTAKAEELFTAFEARFGRAPNNLERDRLSRQATFATRAAKSHDGQTREQILDRVDKQLRGEVAGGLRGVAHAALARGQGPAVQAWSPRAVLETALADLQARKAAWTRATSSARSTPPCPNTSGACSAM
jgi:hypothetical protein